jgi:addiction module HigA family antidote
MMYNPAHPGEIIQEYMEGLGLTVSALAAHLKITRANLSRMIHGRTGVSAEMALRLSEAFGNSPEVWIRLQANYDLAKAMRNRGVKIARLAAFGA